ncbi:unannotated protein [freshwater metagenome]|uniref:Unannotated protein n=1 Tax=freshwater metagenome TaxID=449393 RepID=A0A6J7FTK9_9ZZZZ
MWAVVAGALVFRLASSSSDSPNLGALKVGDCIDVPTGTTLSKVKVIECSVVHTNEVYAIGDTNTTVNVANTALGNEAEPEIKRICGTDVDPTLFARLTSTAGVEAGYLIGGKRTGRVVCVVTMAPRTGSLVADSTR